MCEAVVIQGWTQRVYLIYLISEMGKHPEMSVLRDAPPARSLMRRLLQGAKREQSGGGQVQLCSP